MYTYMYLANTNTVHVHVYTCIINTESDSIQLHVFGSNLHVQVPYQLHLLSS